MCNVSRQAEGNRNGIMPSRTSINPNAISKYSSTMLRRHYLTDLPELFRYLKKAELGSITITSLLSLKLCL